jgi:hypothetical protein
LTPEIAEGNIALVDGEKWGSAMYAEVGDRVVIGGRRAGECDRIGIILDVRQPDRTPPYLVRWDHDGHETMFFPGPDAFFMRRESESS